jgi:hypothetical protein
LTSEKLASAGMLILTGGVIVDRQWKMIESYLRKGGSLWLAAGSSLSADSCNAETAQKILPASLKGPERLGSPMPFKQPGRTSGLYEPFNSGENPPISDIRCFQRFSLPSVAADAGILLEYADGLPAMLTRSVGMGQVVLWNFSPARQWSSLGRLGGQLVILADYTEKVLIRTDDVQRQFKWRSNVEFPVRDIGRVASASLREPDGFTRHMEVGLNQKRLNFEPTLLGNFSVTFNGTEEQTVDGFSVNVAASEGDMRRVEDEKLLKAFPEDSCRIISSADQLGETGDSGGRLVSILPLMLILLLLLMTAESFFANRFYRPDRQAGANGADDIFH